MNQNEYYKYYLSLHQNKTCRLLHFIGQLITIIFTIWILHNWYWYLIPIVPFIVYPFAVSSHYIFGEKGNQPSFHKMGYFRAKVCDLMMFVDILKRKHRIW